MNTYIKHSEADSLTHYGVKGMKWRKGRKTPTLKEIERMRREAGQHINSYAKSIKNKAKKTWKNSLSSIAKGKKKAGIILEYGSVKNYKKYKKQLRDSEKFLKENQRIHKQAVSEAKIRRAVRDFKEETEYGKPYGTPKVWYKKNKTKHQTGVRGTPQKKISTYSKSTKFKGLSFTNPSYDKARLNYTEKTPKKYKKKVTRKKS